MLVASTQSPILRQPGVAPLHDPTDRQFHEPLVVLLPGDDVQLATRLPLLDEGRETRLLVGAVPEQGRQLGVVLGVHLGEDGDAAGPVGDVARRDDHRHRRPRLSTTRWRFRPSSFFPPSKARSSRVPCESVDWLSTLAVFRSVGRSCSRTRSRRESWMHSSVPSAFHLAK
jgi:hypothetical protein